MSDANPIDDMWNLLAGRRRQMMESFYSNLFDRFPDYQQYFPYHMDAQMERMMDVISSIARFSEHTELVRPHLLQVGAAHKKLVRLGKRDLCNFRDVFIDTAAATCGEDWEAWHTKAFQEAFDDTIIPIVYEGFQGNPRGATENTRPGKFELYNDKRGEYRFRLKATNGQIILASQGYKAKVSAKNGIASVQRNSQYDVRFERKDAKGKFMFDLKSANGQVVGTSREYESKGTRGGGIRSVAKNSLGAKTVDLTT